MTIEEVESALEQNVRQSESQVIQLSRALKEWEERRVRALAQLDLYRKLSSDFTLTSKVVEQILEQQKKEEPVNGTNVHESDSARGDG
jgi:exonuclease VII small subunit